MCLDLDYIQKYTIGFLNRNGTWEYKNEVYKDSKIFTKDVSDAWFVLYVQIITLCTNQK